MRHPVRRAASALRRVLHGGVAVWYHPAFRLPVASLEATSGFDPRRAENVLTWALDLHVVQPADVRSAQEARWSWIARVHDEEYLATLDRPDVLARIFGSDARQLATASLLETVRRGVGGTVAAARHAAQHGGRTACLLGGFHHAAPAAGGGFSAINDVAVAITRLRDDGFDGRILIIDTDAHPPDGIAACLSDDPAVTIASIGVASAWDVPANVIDARVAAGTGDDGYLAELARLLRDVGPADLAFFIAGADPLAGDRFGGLACTEAGLRKREAKVFARLGTTPTVLLPAGGYTRGAWRVFANALAAAAGASLAVHPRYDPVLRRSRDIARTLDPQELGTTDEFLSPEDFEDLGVPVAEPRVLGAYTRHGVEYALSRYGFLQALRRMGFDPLEVETTARGPVHRIRVLTTIAGRREALIEIALSRREVEGFTTLFIEWLALRDPRVTFTPQRPQLPGQDAPGLGLSEEAGHLLVRVAERLGLAGVTLIPAHYHVAWIARGRFSFLDPQVRGRFRALATHLAGMPLLRASHLLDGPGIPVRDGEPLRWEPSLMVHAIDPRLVDRLQRGEPEARRVTADLAGRLLPPPPG